MSYEGYSQFLCKKGHYWKVGCYDQHQMYEADDEVIKEKCPTCSEEEVWENSVNTTNGSWDDDGTRIDGFVELKVKSETSGKCSACGEKHICEKT